VDRNVHILDAVTLRRLKSSKQQSVTQLLKFSANGHLLMLVSLTAQFVIWDLQTGVFTDPKCINTLGEGKYPSSSTGSECGTIFGILINSSNTTSINTYTIFGEQIHLHQIEERVTGEIWTHGECIQFATLGPGSITVCQGGPRRSPEIQSTLVWSSCWGATGSAGRSTQRREQRRVMRARGNKGEVGVTRDQCRVW